MKKSERTKIIIIKKNEKQKLKQKRRAQIKRKHTQAQTREKQTDSNYYYEKTMRMNCEQRAQHLKYVFIVFVHLLFQFVQLKS